MRTSSVSNQIEWPRPMACIDHLNSFYVQRSYPGYEDPEYDKQSPTLVMQHEEKTSQFIIGKGSPELEKYLQYVYIGVHRSLLSTSTVTSKKYEDHWSKEDDDDDDDGDGDGDGDGDNSGDGKIVIRDNLDSLQEKKVKNFFTSFSSLSESESESIDFDHEILNGKEDALERIQKTLTYDNAFECMYAALRVAIRWCEPNGDSALQIHELWKLAKKVQDFQKTMCLPLIKISTKRVEHLKEQIVDTIRIMVSIVMRKIPKSMEFVHDFQKVITFSTPEKLSKNIIAIKKQMQVDIEEDKESGMESSGSRSVKESLKTARYENDAFSSISNKKTKKKRYEDDGLEDVPVYFKNFKKSIGIPSIEYPKLYEDMLESLHQWSIDLLRILPPVQEFEVGQFPLYKFGTFLHSMYTVSANIATFKDTDLYKLLAECNNWLNLLYQSNGSNITNNDNVEVKDHLSYLKYKSSNVSRFVKPINISSSSSSLSSLSSNVLDSNTNLSASTLLKKVELLSFDDVTEYIDSLGKPRLIPSIQIAKRHIELQRELEKFKNVIANIIPSNVFVKENGIASNQDLGDVYNPKTHSSFCKPSSIMWNLMKKVTLDILTDPCEIEINPLLYSSIVPASISSSDSSGSSVSSDSSGPGSNSLSSGNVTTPETIFWPVWLYTWTVYELVSEFPIFSGNYGNHGNTQITQQQQQQQEDEVYLWFFIGKWISRQIEHLSMASVPMAEKKYSLNVEKYLNPFQPSIFILKYLYDSSKELDTLGLDVVSKFSYHSTSNAIRFCYKNLPILVDKHYPKARKLLRTSSSSSSSSVAPALARDEMSLKDQVYKLFTFLIKLKHAGGFHRLEKWILHCIFHASFQNRVISNSPALDSF
jgi:hypothetical protein